MTEKESRNRNSDAAFGTKYRIGKCFPKRKQKLYIYFFFNSQPTNFNTTCHAQKFYYIGLQKEFIS
jgi:hypothetical protein